MHDPTKHPMHAGTAQDHDPDLPPEAGRERGDPVGPDGGGINPGPPQRGSYGSSPAAQPASVTRDDAGGPDGGGVNPGPPQRGGEADRGGGGRGES
jgi:hypothetical protein